MRNAGAVRFSVAQVLLAVCLSTLAGSLHAGTPSNVSVTPNSGVGWSQTFQYVFSDPDGWTDLHLVGMMVSPSGGAFFNCWVWYDPPRNQLWLMDDWAQVWLGPMTPQTSGSQQNSQCILSASGSSAYPSSA